MGNVTGAWLSAAAGAIAGAVTAFVRSPRPSRRMVVCLALLGALTGALAFAGFLILGSRSPC